jgi:hypothetical protein
MMQSTFQRVHAVRRRCALGAALLAGVVVCLAVGSGGCAALKAAAGQKEGNVPIRQIDYHGWEGSYLMTNGDVEVVVVPQIARIMEYRPAGGENLLWVNRELMPDYEGELSGQSNIGGWPNHGGYKLWPAPQSAWNWPPPPKLDRGPCEAEITDGEALRLTGQPDPEAGIRFDRLIRLSPSGTRLEVDQVMVNASDRPVEWAIWDVTQVPSDCVGFVPLGPGATVRAQEGEEPGEQWRRAGDMLLVRPDGTSEKVFITGRPSWLGCRIGGWIFVKAFESPAGATPEGETPREVYVGGLGYIELEVVGPSVRLEPGEQTVLPETWHLVGVNSDEMSDDRLAEQVRMAVRPLVP